MRRKRKTISSRRGRKRLKKTPYLVECLQLPGDAVMGMELTAICGDRELTVRSFRCIREVSKNRIVIQAKRHNIVVTGECLALDYYTAEEVKVKGQIGSVLYENR